MPDIETKLVLWYPFDDYKNSVMVPSRALIDPWSGGWDQGRPIPNYIAEPDAEMIDWIQHCYELLESNQLDRLVPDPFFVSPRGEITEEVINELIEDLDKEFEKEMTGNWESTGTAHTHYQKSGAQTTPDFHRMPPRARRAMVEGLAVIKDKWMKVAEELLAEQENERPAEAGPSPSYTSYEGLYGEWD